MGNRDRARIALRKARRTGGTLNRRSLRMVVLVNTREYVTYLAAARSANVSLAEYMRQAANEKLERNGEANEPR